MKKSNKLIRSTERSLRGRSTPLLRKAPGALRCQAATLNGQLRWRSQRKQFAQQNRGPRSGLRRIAQCSAAQAVRQPSKQRIKNTAYQGEIGRKVELSKRRKIITPIHEKPGQQAANFKRYLQYFKKKTWYTDKAAPIPGGNQKVSTGFVRKNKFYKKIFRAYRLFKTYMSNNKKDLKKVCIKSMHNRNNTDFSIIMHMDSIIYSTMRKSMVQSSPRYGYADGAQHWPRHKLAPGRQAKPLEIGISPYFLNGKYVTKKNFVLYRKNKIRTIRAYGLKDGDICIVSLCPDRGFASPYVLYSVLALQRTIFYIYYILFFLYPIN